MSAAIRGAAADADQHDDGEHPDGESSAPADEREEPVDAARCGRISLLRHGVGSVPRQTGDVTPESELPSTPTARDRVVVEGPDALTYLQSQIAQDIRALAVGESCLDAGARTDGKVDSLARVDPDGRRVFVFDIDAGFGEALAARLRRFKIRVAAEIEVVPADASRPSPASRGRPHRRRVGRRWGRRSCRARRSRRSPA